MATLKLFTFSVKLNQTELFSPEGRKFRSRNELRQYLDKHNLDHNPDDFDFSIWGRGNRPPSKSSLAAATSATSGSNLGGKMVTSTAAKSPNLPPDGTSRLMLK